MHFGSVLVTGASSGIGRAIALECARPGAVLHLSGRDAARLEATAACCRERGADARPVILDVRDAEAMTAWIGGAGRLDLAVANAGVSAGTGDGGPETHAQARALFATNLGGVLNTAFPALTAMEQQVPGPDGVRGRIAVVASIAAFVPAPGAPSYCASKAAVDAWAVATALIARQRGIQLTSICPGYVRTAMTARNRFAMPGLMDPERAARAALAGVAAGRVRVVFPRWLGAAARLTGMLPPKWSGALLSMQPGKDANPTP
jgi:NAD(P)-dependent dehydrogenase (short-subunit alcohol dehydrogenase family)